MTSPLLVRIGLAPSERAVILHADDLGMCHAHNTAFAEVVAGGTARCGSVMVPTPWFSEAAEFAGGHPEADVGVHITLTSEWRHYRWRPISTVSRASGLMDDDGYFWHTTEQAQRSMVAEAAIDEARAQIELALAAGIDVTHIDAHMGAVFRPDLILGYVGLAMEFAIPALLPRPSEQVWELGGFSPDDVARYKALISEGEAEGMAVFDAVAGARLDRHEAKLDEYDAIVASLPPGLCHVYYHAASDGDEIRAIAPDHAARAADLAVMTDERFRAVLRKHGARVIGYRDLRDAARAMISGDAAPTVNP